MDGDFPECERAGPGHFTGRSLNFSLFGSFIWVSFVSQKEESKMLVLLEMTGVPQEGAPVSLCGWGINLFGGKFLAYREEVE